MLTPRISRRGVDEVVLVFHFVRGLPDHSDHNTSFLPCRSPVSLIVMVQAQQKQAGD